MSMTPLPPGGWPNLATNQDLLELEGSVQKDLLSFEARFKAHFLRTILIVNLSISAAFAGIVIAAVH